MSDGIAGLLTLIAILGGAAGYAGLVLAWMQQSEANKGPKGKPRNMKPAPEWAGTPKCSGWDDPESRCPLAHASKRCQCWKTRSVKTSAT